ncbi:MAG TPA: transglycosylase SLT domain-containing protein, partial [Bryobacteraceae bacterium]|nr:transglycosylase SLT domain-containing protein [Bryobacteraceae bacterium]
TKEQVVAFIHQVAPAWNLDADLIIRQCEAESGFRQDAVSKCGAIGLMQLMPATAAGLKVNPRDWQANISGGCKFMAQMLARFGGDPAKALAAYNCGPGRLAGILETHGDEWRDHLPTETKVYLKKILEVPRDAGE